MAYFLPPTTAHALIWQALFPVLDSDGILKPAILLLVEEALEAGLQSVVIVVSKAKHPYHNYHRDYCCCCCCYYYNF